MPTGCRRLYLEGACGEGEKKKTWAGRTAFRPLSKKKDQPAVRCYRKRGVFGGGKLGGGGAGERGGLLPEGGFSKRERGLAEGVEKDFSKRRAGRTHIRNKFRRGICGVAMGRGERKKAKTARGGEGEHSTSDRRSAA